MIAVDTNILVYAHREDSPWHAAAFAAVARLAEGRAAWALPWPCVHEFLAIVTHPRIYVPPSPLAMALSQIDAWVESPSLVLLSEGPTYWGELRGAIASAQIAGPQIHDARVAALCQSHGVRELWTADRDFRSIPGSHHAQSARQPSRLTRPSPGRRSMSVGVGAPPPRPYKTWRPHRFKSFR